ncbi:MAG: hypothetical protein HGA38_04700 [Candidatus Moranbacteria bacterium]|nr:hypothetical protein [Candidatus Moranbacteria bacterium]NTW46315.1 hypothetical protein [Candidatus Moranbacteria bacterium]
MRGGETNSGGKDGASVQRTLPGMTLVEALVAISVMTVAMAGFSLLFVRAYRSNAFILETGAASAAASRGVDRLISNLRKIRQGDDGSYPIVSGSGSDLKVFLDIDDDGKTERVHYYLQNGALRQGVTEPSATQPVTYPSSDQVVTTVASNVANATDEPVFSYYNDDYPGDTVNNPLATPIAVEEARLVRVRLIININPNRAPEETNVESIAEFRNLNEYVR